MRADLSTMENPKAEAEQMKTSVKKKHSGAISNDKVGERKGKRKRKEVAPFGNYRNYYGYRLGQGLEEDPRLRVFRKEWFQDKDCLDIGCNSGLITITVARKFKCRSILGIDIDNDRIQDAYWHMRKVIRMGNCEKSGASLDGDVHILKSPSFEERDLSKVVSFRKENFVQNWGHPPGKLYDTIICLSVTKWIHLNWGDDGLITLFSKIWKLLQPGGTLVLEPQPWTSYENNRSVSQTTAANCRNIMFYPNTFQELLLDKIGFRRVEDLTSDLVGTKKGFNRPILAFTK